MDSSRKGAVPRLVMSQCEDLFSWIKKGWCSEILKVCLEMEQNSAVFGELTL